MTHRSICYPLQYSCLGNLKDRGAWWTTVHGVMTERGQELDTTQRLTHSSCDPSYSLDTSMYCCCCSVAQPWAPLCDPMYCSTPGFSVLQYLLEFPHTNAPWVNDVTQPSITFYFIFILWLLLFWPDNSVNIITFLFSLPIFNFRSLSFPNCVLYMLYNTEFVQWS